MTPDQMQDPKRPSYDIGATAEENPADGVLRKLASWLGTGGYNAPTMDADAFHTKIVWGVENAIREETEVLRSERDAAIVLLREARQHLYDHSGHYQQPLDLCQRIDALLADKEPKP